MPQVSAGLLLYRKQRGMLEVLLAHPGGPFWRKKDEGAWTIPKGEVNDGEDPLDAAKREFEEETGHRPIGRFIALEPVKQKSGKVVHAWAVEGDLDTTALKSNNFKMEWPPKSGKQSDFPELDRAEFFDLDTAKKKINKAQIAFIIQLEAILSTSEG